VEMCRFLIHEDTRRCVAVFGCTKSLESFLDDCRVLAMVIGMHLNVWRTDVHLATAILQSPSKKRVWIGRHEFISHHSTADRRYV